MHVLSVTYVPYLHPASCALHPESLCMRAAVIRSFHIELTHVLMQPALLCSTRSQNEQNVARMKAKNNGLHSVVPAALDSTLDLLLRANAKPPENKPPQ